MSQELKITKLLADKINISILLLLRTQPLHCRKLSTILKKDESQIARRLAQMERANIIKSEWIHKGRNIKVYFLLTDRIRIQITDEGIQVTSIPEKKEKVIALESIFHIDIPEPEQFINRKAQLQSLSQSPFFVLTGIAGIGKTTLASFYAKKLKEKGKKVFWHTFSELDSVLFVIKKLAIFLSKYNCPHLLDYLKAEGTDMRVMEALLQNTMNNQDFAFFFDDYHLVMDKSMDNLFKQLKQILKGKICITSRYKPPFVTAFDNIMQVRLEEMDINAIEKFLEKKGVFLHGQVLEKIGEKIGGHPLALELLCQAAAGLDPAVLMENIPSFKIESFLWDEIYSRLNPPEQKLLVSLSVFRKPVTVDAIKFLCTFPHVRTVIKQLIKKNLIKRVDGGYCHHAVTRSFCFKIAPNPDDLHRKAAAFYEHTQTPTDILEAIYHLLQAGDPKEGANLIVEYSDVLIGEGYALQVLTFCKELNSLVQPQLMEIEGDIYLLKGEYDTAVTCFRASLEGASDLKKASLYRKLGDVYERKRDYHKAETLFLKGLDMLKEQDVVEQGTIMVKLAKIYAALNESDRALSFCEDALTCFSQSEYKKGIANVYNQMGEILRFTDTEKALEYLFSSLEISQSIGDVRLSASILISIGTVLYESGQSREAVKYYEESLKLSEKIGDMVGIARCCNNLGVEYALEGKWSHAMEYYNRTLSICLKINDKKGIAFSYSNLGRAYSRLGLLEKAREYFFASLKLREELSDTRAIAYLYYNIGLTFQDMGDFQKAFEWITKSLYLRESVDYVLGMAYCYATMGELSGEMGEFNKALEYFEKILTMYGREQGNWMVATAKVFSAKVFVAKKEYEKALQVIEGTIDVLEAVKNRGIVVEAHLITAEAHLRLGNWNQALEHAEISLQHAIQMGSIKLEGKARRIHGVLFSEMGEYEKAEDELRLSMRLLKRYTHELAITYVEFALLCRRMGAENRKYRVFLQKALQMFKDAGATAYEALCREYLEQF